jgi:lysophospholipase L1-like esterase
LPDILIISVGVNDSARLGHSQGRNFTNFEVFTAELENLLERSQQLCQVLFVGMVPVDETKMPFMDCLYFNLADQYRYKEATRLACQARQIPYLDIFDLWQKRGQVWCQQQLCADGLHPNISGYRALLQDILTWEPVARLS